MGMYVTQRDDPTATATFGGRYVFSEMQQHNLDVTIRADVALTPNLSLQLYAQPFVASGDYQRFKELAAPSTFTFVRYGVDGGSTLTLDEATNVYEVDPDGGGPAEPFSLTNPDFLVRSLRSNLVMRWEYVPGSTLFLVWNHGRFANQSDPSFRALNSVRDLFRDDQRNTLLIKANLWFSA
jgi:hypothetical protein